MNGPEQRTIDRLEAARKVLDSGDHDEPFRGFFPAVIEVLELAERRIRRDPNDPLIDYASMVADSIIEDAS